MNSRMMISKVSGRTIFSFLERMLGMSISTRDRAHRNTLSYSLLSTARTRIKIIRARRVR